MRRNTNARTRSVLLAALLIGAALTGDAAGAVLHLEGGRRIVGRIVARDAQTLTIRAYGGDLTVRRADIVRIEGDRPGPDIDALVRTHRRSLRRGDVAGALRLADLAKEHRLTAEEGALLQLASSWEPGSSELRSRLLRWERTSRRLPATAAAVARVRRDFGGPCETHRTLHYVIAYDGTAAAAGRAGEALERTWTRLYELADALSLELRVPGMALPVHLRGGHSHWTQFMDTVGELFDTSGGLAIGAQPVRAPDGSRHVESCELVAAVRGIEEDLTARRTALASAVDELKEARETVRRARAGGERLWASRARLAADASRRLLDEESRRRASLETRFGRTEELLAELPRVHPLPAGPHEDPAAGSAWSVARHEGIAGERLVSRLERLEATVVSRFEEGAALGPEELDTLDERIGGVLDLAIPHRLSLRDRAKSAAALRRALADGVAASDRVALTRGAARQLALEAGLLAPGAPTWLTEGVAALIETGDGETDALERGADPLALAGWHARPREALAELLSGDAFRADFASARDDAAALLRVLVEHHPAAAGRYLTDVNGGRAVGLDAAEFERRFGPIGSLVAAPTAAE